MSDPNRHESLKPEVTEADQRHIMAFIELSKALGTPILNDLELRIAVARTLEATVRPPNDDYTDIRAQIDVWASAYSYDCVSTRYGDRESNNITLNKEGEHVSTDDDGSGARSANKKRAGLVYDVALYLATSPDSLLSASARGTIIRSATSQASKYSGMSPAPVRERFEADLLRYADVYYQTENLDHMILVLGAAVAGIGLTEQREFAFLRDALEVEYGQA